MGTKIPSLIDDIGVRYNFGVYENSKSELINLDDLK